MMSAAAPARAPAPVVLEGAHVRLEPLAPGHLDALCAVGLDEELWRWTIARATTRPEMQAWLDADFIFAFRVVQNQL